MATKRRYRTRPHVDARILIAGDPFVGKTSTWRCLANVPKEEALKTTRTFSADTIIVRYDMPDGRYMVLEIIDIAGDMEAGSLVRSYFRDLDGVLLMCDVTRPETLDNLATRWIPDIVGYHTGNEAPRYMVIANKCDMPDEERKITPDQVKAFCKAHRIRRYAMSSAATWSRATHPNPIEKFFLSIVSALVMRAPRSGEPKGIRLDEGGDDDDDEGETFKDKAEDELRSNCVLCNE